MGRQANVVAILTRPTSTKHADQPATAPRKHLCPCGRYLGESTATQGHITVKCGGCGKWRKIEFRRVVD